MKNQLIASIVGGLILFIWQFLSWSIANVHGADFQYTANQDQIMEVLSQHLEQGNYLLPQPPKDASQADQQAFMESHMGKPWAMVQYRSAMSMSMGMNMFRGLVVDMVAVFLLVWLLGKFASLNFQTILLSALAIGGIGYLTIPYLNSIWFEGNTIGYLVDAVVSWGLVGSWLGWWMTRRAAA